MPTAPSLAADAEEVGAWLRALGLGEYAHAFRRSHIDGEALRELAESDQLLKAEVGMRSFGHRSRMRRALGMRAGTPTPRPRPEPEPEPEPEPV